LSKRNAPTSLTEKAASQGNIELWTLSLMMSGSGSLGADVYKAEKINSRFQIDGDNLNNRLNVIDFGGLFASNAIGPERSFNLRLNTSF
jgi:hypothetical protein